MKLRLASMFLKKIREDRYNNAEHLDNNKQREIGN